jgi:hypothetical protein
MHPPFQPPGGWVTSSGQIEKLVCEAAFCHLMTTPPMAVSCTSLYQRFVIKLGVQLPELSLPHSSLFSKSTACSSGAFFVQQAGGS